MALNPNKITRFHSEHFKIEIKGPKYKDLDINDEHDMRDAKMRLYKELKVLLEDDVFPSLNVFQINGKIIDESAPKPLPELPQKLLDILDKMGPEELREFIRKKEWRNWL